MKCLNRQGSLFFVFQCNLNTGFDQATSSVTFFSVMLVTRTFSFNEIHVS